MRLGGWADWGWRPFDSERTWPRFSQPPSWRQRPINPPPIRPRALLSPTIPTTATIQLPLPPPPPPPSTTLTISRSRISTVDSRRRLTYLKDTDSLSGVVGGRDSFFGGRSAKITLNNFGRYYGKVSATEGEERERERENVWGHFQGG